MNLHKTLWLSCPHKLSFFTWVSFCGKVGNHLSYNNKPNFFGTVVEEVDKLFSSFSKDGQDLAVFVKLVNI